MDPPPPVEPTVSLAAGTRPPFPKNVAQARPKFDLTMHHAKAPLTVAPSSVAPSSWDGYWDSCQDVEIPSRWGTPPPVASGAARSQERPPREGAFGVVVGGFTRPCRLISRNQVTARAGMALSGYTRWVRSLGAPQCSASTAEGTPH